MTNTNQEIEVLSKEVASIEKKVLTEIRNDAENALVSNLLVQVMVKQKETEKARIFLVKDLNDHVKKINVEFKKVSGPLETMEKILKTAITTYRAKCEAVIEKERAKLQEKFEKKQEKAIAAGKSLDSVLMPTVNEIPAVIETKTGEIKTKKDWSFEIVDEKLIPREYLEVNESAIRKAVKSGGVRSIPGVKIFEVENLAVFTRKGVTF